METRQMKLIWKIKEWKCIDANSSKINQMLRKGQKLTVASSRVSARKTVRVVGSVLTSQRKKLALLGLCFDLV